MNKTLFILMASFFLFYCFASKETTPLLETFLPDWESSDPSGALRAYVLGDKKGLSRSLRWAHKALTLQHLFTPSGLHLTSVLMLIRPIFKKVSLILLLIPFFLPGFWAIKRICLLRILKYIFPRLSWFNTFLITFLIDFFIGTFDSSPLSFCFSFLFLGLIFSLEGKNKGALPLCLFAGQVVISFFWQSLVNPVGVFFGQLITIVFSFLFPVFFIGFWFPSKVFLPPLNLFSDTILFLAKVTKFLPEFFVTFDILLLFFLLCSSLRSKIKIYVLLFFIILYPPNLYNLHPKYYKKKRRNDFYLAEESKGISKIKITRRGYKIEYVSGYTCWYYLFNTYWGKNCS